ncbi:uncharacterized protein EI97DRAFT_358728, partial [Westerdykella ornata]
MGRSTQSLGLAPPAVRRDQRAKLARHIVNKVVPAILASNARARKGADGSQLFVDPPANRYGDEEPGRSETHGKGKDEEVETMYVKRKGQGRRKIKERDGGVLREENGNSIGKKGKRRASWEEGLMSSSIAPSEQDNTGTRTRKGRNIRIITTDTLTAAHMLTFPARYPDVSQIAPFKKKDPNVCILNMASPLRPGGGILAGATSQEEFLCARTTLLPSLKDSFYRLPEVGGVYTRDVLVFRDSAPLGEGTKGELGPGERWWVDVVTAGMLRFPELEGEEGEERRLSKKDRDLVVRKMMGVMRIVESQGMRRLVLGAWGCGAYGNPVRDIAEAWRRVLDGEVGRERKGKGAAKEEAETWDHIEEVVFAISNAKMATEFAESFGGGIAVEAGPGGHEVDEEGEEDKVAQELRSKISEMEAQLAQVWNPDLKTRMGVVLDGLRSQLAERESSGGDENHADEDEEE